MNVKPGDMGRCPDCGSLFKVRKNLRLAQHHATRPEGQKPGSYWCKGGGKSPTPRGAS